MRLTKGVVRNSELATEAAKSFFKECHEKKWINWDVKKVLDDNYLMISDHGLPVSILIYCNFGHYFQITGAWTNPHYRRLRIYTKLWNKLVDLAKEKKLRRIDSGYHIANTVSEAMQIAQGRVVRKGWNPEFNSTTYEIRT